MVLPPHHIFLPCISLGVLMSVTAIYQSASSFSLSQATFTLRTWVRSGEWLSSWRWEWLGWTRLLSPQQKPPSVGLSNQALAERALNMALMNIWTWSICVLVDLKSKCGSCWIKGNNENINWSTVNQTIHFAQNEMNGDYRDWCICQVKSTFLKEEKKIKPVSRYYKFSYMFMIILLILTVDIQQIGRQILCSASIHWYTSSVVLVSLRPPNIQQVNCIGM